MLGVRAGLKMCLSMRIELAAPHGQRGGGEA